MCPRTKKNKYVKRTREIYELKKYNKHVARTIYNNCTVSYIAKTQVPKQ